MFRKKDQDGSTPEPAPIPRTATSTPMPARAAAPAAAAASAARPAADATAGKRLIVGEGLSLSGDITACDLLIVEGSVQVTLNDTRAIEIAETGRFTNGKASVEEATISGVYQGELTVRGRLLVRGTGRVDGSIRYGELEVERGGRLAGSIEILDKPAPAAAVKPVPASEPAKTS
jgi:cytoskeletal protein CcmA (bactofilin family)